MKSSFSTAGSPSLAALNQLTWYLSEHYGDCCSGSTVFVWMTEIEEFHPEIMGKGLHVLAPWRRDDVMRRKMRASH
jgi:hypothetical protein